MAKPKSVPANDLNRSAGSGLSTMQALGAGSMGLIFGFALEKGRVFEPKVIQDQMKFKDFTMMKMFLSAVATSQLVFAVLSIVRPSAVFKLQQTYRSTSKPTGLVFVGAVLLGLGMSLSGACPGTLAPQLGTGVRSAPFALIGGFLGSFLYLIVERWLPKKTKGKGGDSEKDREVMFMNDMTRSFAVPAIFMSSALVVMIFGLEQLFPSKTAPLSELSIKSKAFPPYVAGFLIGLLQFPAAIIVTETIGSASCYMVLTQSFVKSILPNTLASGLIVTPVKKWWQVVYLSSAVFGAYLSASLSGSLGKVSSVEDNMMAVIGGMVLLFGSRMAGGCTSGHGISGMGLLSFKSMVAVASMFVGGFAGGLLLVP
ncbi:hypothetical protein BKA69DRAFT_717940 [Paraphysoderma sedebokerense]|nr:hypothetical protein BKA69DRAFT_717940 [Paraphysoderma sedebokerense]